MKKASSRPEALACMIRVLQKIPYAVLVPLAVFMLLAPFKPMPHVMEKLIMLMAGTLSRAVDIFDLCYHLAPLATSDRQGSGMQRRQGKKDSRAQAFEFGQAFQTTSALEEIKERNG
jgi:hypothetical protein